MYWVRCAIVLLIVFSLAYVALSTVLAAVWNAFQRRLTPVSANALFALRIAPVAIAYVLVTVFTLPAFLYFEPPSMQEGIRTIAIIGAACALAFLAIGVIRSFLAWRNTAKLVAACAGDHSSVRPAVFVSGVFRSRLMISSAARALLNERQLAAAVRHESAHASRHDNLKQLILRFCAFPLLGSMDRAWLRAAEIAADDAAVNDEQSALDLASALTTIARNAIAIPELGMSLVPEIDSPLKIRIERLLAWTPIERKDRDHFGWLVLGCSVALLVVLNASTVFAQAHEITELLFVR
jgi:beta-lactamase regulating signal transducer with metallopeptidase domain